MLILLTVVPLFAVNGRWGQAANPDSVAVAVAAWQLSNEGTLDLSEFDVITENLDELGIWYVEDEGGRVVSNRMPGLIALATPAYWMAPPEFSNAPATAMAMSMTVGALIVLWFAFRRIVPISVATTAIITLGLGTTTWAISSAEMWPHGPGQLWAALVVLLVPLGRYWATGLAYAASIMTRPPTAIFAAFTGVAESWRTRSWQPAAKIAAGSVAGLLVVLLYNRSLFGSWSVSGGYSDAFTTGAIERFELEGYLRNLLEMFVGARHGFLVTSPVLGVAAFGAIRHREQLEGWMISLAGAGVAYLIVHSALNRASGGLAVFYRYPLSAIVLMSPVLLVGASALAESSSRARRIVIASLVVSVALQVTNVFILSCELQSPPMSCLLD